MTNVLMKKAMIGGLALMMMIGGATSAFANNNGKGNEKSKGKNEKHKIVNLKNDNKNQFNNPGFRLAFDDMKGSDVEWAIRYIVSLASKGVFEGYEDGTFQPRKTIPRIEAITAAVRLMGLRDQAESASAMQTNLNFSDADKLKRNYSWATGYVAVALQNDLFSESDAAVQPDKEADRLWATTLLVKALKLQDEAKAKMNTKLNFKDADKIPAGSVGYVAVAIEKRLIDGYDDRTFRPNQPVTRAEMAALLDRTGTQIPGNDQGNNVNNIRGAVYSTLYNNMLNVTTNNQTVSYTLDNDVFIYRNGLKVNASELQAGDEVRMNLFNGRIVFVEVTKMVNDTQGDFTVFGTLNSYTINSRGEIATVSVNQTINGVNQTSIYNISPSLLISGDLSLLTQGRSIELRGKDQLVSTIIIR